MAVTPIPSPINRMTFFTGLTDAVHLRNAKRMNDTVIKQTIAIATNILNFLTFTPHFESHDLVIKECSLNPRGFSKVFGYYCLAFYAVLPSPFDFIASIKDS